MCVVTMPNVRAMMPSVTLSTCISSVDGPTFAAAIIARATFAVRSWPLSVRDCSSVWVIFLGNYGEGLWPSPFVKLMGDYYIAIFDLLVESFYSEPSLFERVFHIVVSNLLVSYLVNY